MSKIANIDPLVGRHFVTKSGKLLRVERLGKGAIRLVWSGNEHSAEDEEEFVAWAESVLGYPLTPTHHDDRQREAEALRRWQRENRK